MSARFEFTIAGASLWTPGYVEPAAFSRRARDEAITKPAAMLLPARLRRRTSLLTRMVADVFAQAAEQASVERGAAGVVFASAYGEIQTTGTLLRLYLSTSCATFSWSVPVSQEITRSVMKERRVASGFWERMSRIETTPISLSASPVM